MPGYLPKGFRPPQSWIATLINIGIDCGVDITLEDAQKVSADFVWYWSSSTGPAAKRKDFYPEWIRFCRHHIKKMSAG
jgi:hypothetical protein